MSFLNLKDIAGPTIIIDATLTDAGRRYMAQGNFTVAKFALGDDEIDYGLWDTTPSGSNFVKPYGQVIDNQPVFEPIITNTEIMNSFIFKHRIEESDK